MGSKLGCYIPLPLTIALSLVVYKIKQKCYTRTTLVLCKIEPKWMCQSHGILQLPNSLLRTVVLPLHFYLSYGLISELDDLPIEDAQLLSLELSLEFHLNHIPIYHMVRIMYIFLKQRNMKNIMSSSVSRKCKSICNWPYSFKYFKHPTISSDILAQLPSFKELLFSLTLR